MAVDDTGAAVRSRSAPIGGRALRRGLRAGLLLVTALGGGGFAAVPAAAADAGYTLGVMPFLPLQRMQELFAPLALELSERLGTPVELQTARRMDAFLARFQSSDFDIAFVQPFAYTRLAGPLGYVPVATRKGQLRATVVVAEQRGFMKIPDLRGQVLATPPRDSAVELLTRLLLRDAGLPEADVTAVHVSSHDACLQLVLARRADACAAANTPVRAFSARFDARFRSIAMSPEIPPSPFIVHPGIGAPQLAAIQRAILGLSLHGVSPELRQVFAGPDRRHPFRSVSDADYDIVRNMWRSLQGETPDLRSRGPVN